MPIYANDPGPRRRRPRRKVILAPFRGVPRLRRLVERDMREAIDRMRAEVAAAAANTALSPRTKSEHLQGLLDKWGGEFQVLADKLAWRLAHETDLAGKKHWIKQASKAMGVPAAVIFDTPRMMMVVDSAAVAAATYIKTIPQEHIGRVAAAVIQAVRQERLPEGKTLAQTIRDIGEITVRRARFIARDQVHKVLGDIDEAQQRDLGVAEFVWENSGDERVVGNPAGRYPKATRMHGDHWHRQGKVFRWDNLPGGEKPGGPPGCRCYARPVIDVEAIFGGRPQGSKPRSPAVAVA